MPPALPRFVQPLIPRLDAAVAALDKRLSLEAKISFKRCDDVLAGPGALAPAALPPDAQAVILASAAGDVHRLARALQAVKEDADVTLESDAIAGTAGDVRRAMTRCAWDLNFSRAGRVWRPAHLYPRTPRMAH